MPHLTPTQWNKLYQYPLTRNGYVIRTTQPNPNLQGNDPNAGACWSWALAGQPVFGADPRNVDEMFDNIFTRPSPVAPPTALNDAYLSARSNRAQIQPYIHTILANADAANRGDVNAIRECRGNLLLIAATNAGLQPVKDTVPSNYWLHANIKPTEAWYARFDHFALRLSHPDNGTVSFIQKVPNTGVCYGCNVMWDEAYPQTAFKIAELLPKHVEVIALI